MTTANELYEKEWNAYLSLLRKDVKARLTPFLREECVNVRGMYKWMSEKGLSVQIAKKQIRQLAQESLRASSGQVAETTGPLFMAVAPTPESRTVYSGADLLSGISFTFPDGTQVSIKSGSARAVMSFMKLYQREEALCLD